MSTKAQTPNIPKGTPVTYMESPRKGGQMKHGTFSHWTDAGEGYIKMKDDAGRASAVWRKWGKFTIVGDAQTTFEVGNISPAMESLVNQKFNINQRFDFLSSLVRMVIKNKSKSLVVTGDGGLGKTFTVLKEIKDNPTMIKGKSLISSKAKKKGDFEEEDESDDEGFTADKGNYVYIKGYSTAKGLYKTMYENRHKLLVYDDCDEILENPVAVNLLAAALDSYEERIVHWISTTPFGQESELPDSFEFTGRIIFISNKPKHRVPQKLLSRAQNIDLTMNVDDKIKRMNFILPSVCPEVPLLQKQEAMDVIEVYRKECRDLNLRTLLKIIEIRTSDDHDDWKGLAEFTLLS